MVAADVEDKKGNVGYNAFTGEFEDLMKAGVIDPKKVTRSALQNAASIGTLLLTVETMVTDLPEDKEEKATIGAVLSLVLPMTRR